MWISYFSIDFDYFSKHYEEEIIENGIVCRDMIRLAMELNKTYNYLGEEKMEVHKAITAHSRKQNESVKACLQLDAQREATIEVAVSLASNGKEFSVDVINVVTKQINDLAKMVLPCGVNMLQKKWLWSM